MKIETTWHTIARGLATFALVVATGCAAELEENVDGSEASDGAAIDEPAEEGEARSPPE